MSNATPLQSLTSISEVPFVPGRSDAFTDRRFLAKTGTVSERRQFGNSNRHLSSAGKELADAIDAYKLNHRRRFITTDEMLHVLADLGYRKS